MKKRSINKSLKMKVNSVQKSEFRSCCFSHRGAASALWEVKTFPLAPSLQTPNEFNFPLLKKKKNQQESTVLLAKSEEFAYTNVLPLLPLFSILILYQKEYNYLPED